MSLLELKKISVAYGDNVVLKDLDLEIEQGKLVSLLGPSGCGKTTTLRMVAGFIEAQQGKFTFNNRDYTHIPPHQKNFGFVFQSYALFPHLTAFDNIAFGLKLRKIDKAEIKKRVEYILKVVDLGSFYDRYPGELSGGQQQRVALARALVIKPDLLLLDEPLSNLDAKLRIKMRVEIKRIQKEMNITTIYVTHDQEECFSISDQVAIMNKGVIEQLDSPERIYQFPETEFVARFVGFENFIDFEVGSDHQENILITEEGDSFKLENASGSENSSKVKGAIRPDDIELKKRGGVKRAKNTIEGDIFISTFLGKEYQYVVKTKLGRFLVNDNAEKRYRNGEKVNLYFPEGKIVLVK